MKKAVALFLTMLLYIQGFSQVKTESIEIKNTFFNFLKYYQKNEEKFNSFRIYEGAGSDSSEPPFHINWEEAKKYFNFLRKNVPYVGEVYIQNEERHFQQAQKDFKTFPDEPIPPGFDYDRFVNAQESVEYVLPLLENKKNKIEVIFSGENATLRIGVPLEDEGEDSYSWNIVPFKKENGKWEMAGNITWEDI